MALNGLYWRIILYLFGKGMIFGLISIKLIVLLLFGLFFGINVKDKGFFCFSIFNVKDLFGLFRISIIKVIYCVKG